MRFCYNRPRLVFRCLARFQARRRPFAPVLAVLAMLLLCDLAAEARTITFAGRDWVVRSGGGGPGPNRWSDSTESVWVDKEGLHLKIRKEGDTWYCAEVTSVKPARYGIYRFYISSRVDELDPNIVAAPFLYKDDTHEIDIEFTRWKNPAADNAQYVVQPYDTEGNMLRFDATLTGDYSTHSFDWSAGVIQFQSLHGHHAGPPAPEHIIQEWTCTSSDIPSESDGLRIHINFWLVEGLAPSDGQEAELIIKHADLPPPPE